MVKDAAGLGTQTQAISKNLTGSARFKVNSSRVPIARENYHNCGISFGIYN